MPITEMSVIDQITVLADGQILVRRADRVLRDGVEIATSYHRHVLSPGEGVIGQDPRVRDIAKVVHTAAVIRAFDLARGV